RFGVLFFIYSSSFSRSFNLSLSSSYPSSLCFILTPRNCALRCISILISKISDLLLCVCVTALNAPSVNGWSGSLISDRNTEILCANFNNDFGTPGYFCSRTSIDGFLSLIKVLTILEFFFSWAMIRQLSEQKIFFLFPVKSLP